MSRRRPGVSSLGYSVKKTRQGAKRRSKPLPSGEFEAQIDDLSEEGFGVARIDGKVCFIDGALPGETVRFAYTHVAKNLDQGRVTEIITPSAHRVPPPCPHFGVCGACTLQHLSPKAQIARKQEQLIETLRRVGHVEAESVAPPILGPELGYRRRARLGVRYVVEQKRTLIGFRERSSNLLARIEQCAVLDPRIGTRLLALAQFIDTLSIRRQIPQIEVACGENALALVFRLLETPTTTDLEKFRAFEQQENFTLFIQTGGPDSIEPLSPSPAELSYSPDGSSAASLLFQPSDFIQINALISQQAVRQAIDWLNITAGQSVLELFSGLGNFSIPLALAGATLTTVEGERGLVQRAAENARRLGLNIEGHLADLFEPIQDANWLTNRPYDAVLLDPPRAGAEAMMAGIAKIAPQRVVYVSCHPATLARDAGILVNDFGYRLRQVGVMDMFPHTAHVESMALFERMRG